MGRFHYLLLSGFLAGALVGCGSDQSTAPSSPRFDDSWPTVPDADWVRVLSDPVATRDVWYGGPRTIVALGVNGHISRFDGTRWTLTDPDFNVGMGGIWGSSSGRLWAVGALGSVFYYDGTTWAKEITPTDEHLRAVWGRSADEIYAVGRTGTILEFDGSSWRAVPSGTEADLEAVSGTDDGVVVAVGASGTVLLKRPGEAWSTIRGGETESLVGVSVFDAADIVVLGNAGNPVALRYDGSTWSDMSAGLAGEVHGVTGFAPDDLWVAGKDGAFRYEGSAWSLVREPGEFSEGLTALAGASSEELVTVSLRREAMIREGETWTTWSTALGGHGFQGISGTSDDDIVLVGAFFQALRYRGNGEWTVLQDVPVNIQDAWTSPDGDVYAVAWRKGVFRLVGDRFVPFHEAPVGRSLITIWGTGSHLFAAGEDGVVVHYDGSTWTETSLPTAPRNRWIHDLDGTGPEDVYAIGTETVFHFDGEGWTPVLELESPTFLDRVAVAAGNEVYVVGSRDAVSELRRWDGASFEVLLSTSEFSLGDVAAHAGGNMVVSGFRFGPFDPGGVVFHYADGTPRIETMESNFQNVDAVWISPSGTGYLAGQGLWMPKAP